MIRGSSRLERWGLCACLGPGIFGLCLIFLSFAGMRPGRGEILILATIFAAAGIIVHFTQRKHLPQPVTQTSATSRSWWIICLAVMAYGLYMIASNVLVYPVVEWDAFAIWQLKAKVLALHALNPRPEYFSNVNLSYSHLRYPVLVPMISAGAGAMTNRLEDFCKTPALLFYAGLGAIVFATIRRLNGTTAALAGTALLLSLEPILRYGGSGTAEMALTAFYGCSLVCILRWQESGDWGSLLLAAIYSACMAWTKNEGMALAAINAVVLPIIARPEFRRRGLLAGVVLVAIVAVLYSPWAIFVRGLPGTDENYLSRLTPHEILGNSSRLPTILEAILLEFVNVSNWGVFWIVVFGLAILQRRQLARRPIAAVGLLLVLHLLAYIPAYMVTTWKIDELLRVTTDRLLMHAAPAAALLIGMLWPRLIPSPQRVSLD
jgi:hypothetical protein